ncbi:MAG: hypothetical protein F4109_00375 [Gammaproteobacteria bacterium]|nr:hypothetical protein [Gammaproteobacteria bacterium]MYD01449.1 hypothetical protein [Gammaproteobacteria bacterium]MYI23879.1 hypothetical protein [Gammaproteobacteria bacterium]
MPGILPINLADLLYCRGIESERVEFKASWNPQTTGPQILKTICAFANDFHNLNGGYIVLGLEEKDGRAKLPPKGLETSELDVAQKWINGNCKRLDPSYQPTFSPEVVNERAVLVIWAPASDIRPHRGPDGDTGVFRYWVRLGSETVNAEQKGDMLRQLIQQTAKVPWDDRPAREARVEDLRETQVREFLRDIQSSLLDEPDASVVYRNMRITRRVNQHESPRNVGLLFFSNEPTHWFRGAKIEVVQFAADRGGDVLEERTFAGPLKDQFHDCLNHLENLSATHLEKQRDRSQVRGWVSYPLPALRETLANALYHRSYDVDQPEPSKVYLYPDRIEVTSYPGPVPGIEPEHLTRDGRLRPVPARNRRIGELFKELKLAEGRMTGLARVYRAMDENGSPPPRFEFDRERTYFLATLPAHPEYAALSALRDAGHLRALGDENEAHRRLVSAWTASPESAVLTAEVIRSYAKRQELIQAEEAWEEFKQRAARHVRPHVANTMIEVWFDANEKGKAGKLLGELRLSAQNQDAVDAAILARRLHKENEAHHYFERAGAAIQSDPRALHEFAQTKMGLATEAFRRRRGRWKAANRKFLMEARELLERVIQLDAPRARHAFAWRDLARVREFLHEPATSVEDAYERAMSLLPGERQFQQNLENFRTRRAR